MPITKSKSSLGAAQRSSKMNGKSRSLRKLKAFGLWAGRPRFRMAFNSPGQSGLAWSTATMAASAILVETTLDHTKTDPHDGREEAIELCFAAGNWTTLNAQRSCSVYFKAKRFSDGRGCAQLSWRRRSFVYAGRMPWRRWQTAQFALRKAP